ncbi:hypothetical protein C2G38_2262678 [Gigaspora rosea]|uniref:Trypsin-like cysteine/serine peptidase domain-containing protein n=1 Tax=Gigaspora rosea TaxID=44941 RepID=A0A397UL59_9GLOM|nr:hypothetical protein C2G38_2262678 [Gigaspora rosea]
MITRNIYILISIFFMFLTHSMIHAQYEPLAKLWGVSVNEVPNLLDIESNLTMVDSLLTPILDGSCFGGTYIDVKANKIFINTVNSSMIPIVESSPKIKPYINLLSFQSATNSSYHLNYTLYNLTVLAQELKANNVIIIINPKFNNVVIYLNHEDDKTNKNFIDVAAKFYPIMNYSSKSFTNSNILEFKIEKRNIQDKVLDGDGLHNIEGNPVCSAGLWMRDANNPNKNYLATAGHCARYQPLNNQGFVDFYHIPWIFSPPTYRYIGPLTQYSFSPYDFGLIEAICPNTSITTIINNFPSRIYRELFIKEVKSITTIGVHVCKSGYTSYATCGFVLNINAKIIGLDVDNNTSVKEGMMLTNLYFDEGDSGSPVYQYSKSLPYVPVVGIGIVGEVGPSLAGVLHLDVILRHYQLVVVVTP